jgi:hypothetical protein
MIVGFGLFFAVPSLLSEGFIEAVAPVVTASDVVSDITINNFSTYVKSWKIPSTDKLWKGTGSTGLHSGGDKTSTRIIPTVTAKLLTSTDPK